MSITPPDDKGALLRQRRLLQDIRELIEDPYPNTVLHVFDEDLSTACLVLTPDSYPPLHLTVKFGRYYPVNPPEILMDSEVNHPNIYGRFICATILNSREEYTPAYTLKGIAIQLLSFFASDSLEQDYGGLVQDLTSFKEMNALTLLTPYKCKWCNFGRGPMIQPRTVAPRPYDARVEHRPELWPTLDASAQHSPRSEERTSTITAESDEVVALPQPAEPPKQNVCAINKLPNEVLLLVIERLEEFQHLTDFARAWPRVSDLVRDFDIVRQRELQCFCLKEDYHSVKLGVGVSIHRGQVSSEFDLLSQQAFQDLHIRRSVHFIRFEHWLPLPISQRHWDQVKGDAGESLDQMKPLLGMRGGFDERVIYTFMNDIVVRLNQVAEEHRGSGPDASGKSTLRHASEKAIESYFHLFHLLVCLATDDVQVVRRANLLLRNFASGRRSKADCPNLGHLLIALLISDMPVTEPLMRSIITEAITRNVVWLLDRRGANMPELAHLEGEAVSAYRLDRTFAGSRTSYRLLMFSELFRRTARPSPSHQHQQQALSLAQVRDELFVRHGAPPRDAAARLASEVRRLHTVDDFPAFLREMGLARVPSPQAFTEVLRGTVRDSMARGYSRMGLSAENALLLRSRADAHLGMSETERKIVSGLKFRSLDPDRVSFFPSDRGPAGGRGGGRGGRGRGRERGH